jgi:formate-dependent nitrite reductase cytochrome c552 subunit
MEEQRPAGDPDPRRRTSVVLGAFVVVFGMLAAAFALNLWGRQAPLYPIPPVDPAFLDTATVRRSYADLVKAKEDLSDFDCYACHERNKPPLLRFDADHNLIIPSEHSDIVMGHGRHNRNNNCFNCHDETNLERFQTRDGRALKLADSTPLCGSCHGPTLRDWEAGAHGRTSGYWNRGLGPIDRKNCVNCHNPHSPSFPPRAPAPGPHPLRVAPALPESSSSAH